MTREEVVHACEQISEWTKFSSRPIHHTVLRLLDHEAKQRKKITDQAMEITTCNLALLERDREIERLKQQYTQEVAKRDCRILELQANLDQVVGEAVVFAAQCDSLGRHPTSTIVEKARTFLDSLLVQSWRARQGKEGV